jgi:hypothetical protein
MRKSILTGVGLLAGLALLPAGDALAQTSGVWLHVRVEETLKPSKVTVNLPLTVVEAALQAAPELIEKHGKMHMGGHDGMKLADLRRVWKQLAAAGDADFVTVESEQENVRIRRQGDLVQVFVSEKASTPAPAKAEAARAGRPHGEVRVELPVSVVDALLSGEGEQVNVQAAVAELQKRRGDIVRVSEKDSQVRIWIDDQNTQPSAAK